MLILLDSFSYIFFILSLKKKHKKYVSSKNHNPYIIKTFSFDSHV